MDTQDLSADPPPENQGGMPRWVWFVGGLGLCAILGICAVAGGLYVIGREAQRQAEEGEGFLVDLLATPVAEPFYHEEFDSIGEWGAGDVEDETVEGGIAASSYVEDGAFEFTAYRKDSYFWSTAEEDFGDGTYAVEATAVGGPLNNGFGMLFMLDEASNSFYLFEVSSDGFVLAVYCEQVCETSRPLADTGWFQSSAVKPGLNETNHLKVRVENGAMTFFVNDEEVASATDTTLQSGNIGILVETFEEIGVQVRFDNFVFNPVQEE